MYQIGSRRIEIALPDLGPSANLISYSVCLKLRLGEPKPLNSTLQSVDKLVITPWVRIDDMLIDVDRGYSLVDFMVLDRDPIHVSQ